MDIGDSIRSILQRQNVVTDLFYTIFLDRYPDVRTYFEGVDLRQQSVLLNMALVMTEQYYQHRYPATEQYLKLLGYRHAQRAIPQDLFPRWRDCLLETLKRFHGAEWSGALEQQWKAAVDVAVSVMHAGYESPQTY